MIFQPRHLRTANWQIPTKDISKQPAARRRNGMVKLKHYNDRAPKWVIRDGQQTLGTGCDECDREVDERKLGEYILKKHDPEKALDRDNPNATKIADILSLEMQHIAKADMPNSRKKQLINICQNMGNWSGDRVVGDLNGELQERYAVERVYQAAAWCDLKILAAAINRLMSRVT
jgi:hypothetical protein